MPGVAVHDDVRTLAPPAVDVVVGGWPCQDISSAGNLAGLVGDRSGLFFKMVDVTISAGAHTLVGENVPNLLGVNGGRDFDFLLGHLRNRGFPYISWRTFNAREFGLAQDRRRVFVVASRYPEIAFGLHAREPDAVPSAVLLNPSSAGFYWTGGGRSICFSRGYVPTLKVGASDSKGRSVVAIFNQGRIWKLSPEGCARLQGFDPLDFEGESKTDIVRMAGNAVPVPMGRFVLDSVFKAPRVEAARKGIGMQTGFAQISENGYAESGMVWAIETNPHPEANNLDEITEKDTGETLSSQAAAGLIVRSVRASKPLPLELFEALLDLAQQGGRIRGSRSNSFEELGRLDLASYRHLIEAKSVSNLAAA
jgi:DNA (cytosine-5)-methyltransferase 1